MVVGPASGRVKQEGPKGKAAQYLAHCFEILSGKLLGDQRNRKG